MKNNEAKPKPKKNFIAPDVYIQTTVSGRKQYIARPRLNGRETTRVIGYTDEYTKQEAVLKASEVIHDLKNGVPVATRIKVHSDRSFFRHCPHHSGYGLSVSDAFSACLVEISRNWTEKTLRDRQSLLINHVYEKIGTVSIQNIKPWDIENLILNLQIEKGRVQTGKKLLILIRQLLTRCEFHEWISNNPAEKIDPAYLLKKMSRNYSRIPIDKAGQLMAQISEANFPMLYHHIFFCLIYSVLRTSTLLSLRWQWLDDKDVNKAKLINIPSDAMKNGKPHSVPITPQLRSHLSQLKDLNLSETLIFPDPKYPEIAFRNKNIVLGMLKKIGFKGKQTGHGFRGWFSTMMNEQQRWPSAIDEQMSHCKKSAVSTAYDHSKHWPLRVEMMSDYCQFLHDSMILSITQQQDQEKLH